MRCKKVGQIGVQFQVSNVSMFALFQTCAYKYIVEVSGRSCIHSVKFSLGVFACVLTVKDQPTKFFFSHLSICNYWNYPNIFATEYH